MAVGVVELLVLAVIIGQMALLLWALVDLAKATDEAMVAAGFNRYVWLAIAIVLPVVGSIAYLVVAKPKLRHVRTPPTVETFS